MLLNGKIRYNRMCLSIFRDITVPWELNWITRGEGWHSREAAKQVICEFISLHNLHGNEAVFIQNSISSICRQLSKWQATAKITRLVDVSYSEADNVGGQVFIWNWIFLGHKIHPEIHPPSWGSCKDTESVSMIFNYLCLWSKHLSWND